MKMQMKVQMNGKEKSALLILGTDAGRSTHPACEKCKHRIQSESLSKNASNAAPVLEF